MNVRVFVVDDQELVREGIRALLGLQPGVEVVGTAADGAAAGLARAVRLAHAGVARLDPSPLNRLAAAVGAPSPLTSRETEVLRLISLGASNKEIASRLHLSEGTVKNHISRILGRLNLRDRTQAALYARENRLI